MRDILSFLLTIKAILLLTFSISTEVRASHRRAIDLEPEYVAQQIRLMAARAYADTQFSNNDYQGKTDTIVSIEKLEERLWTRVPFKYTTAALKGFDREDAGSIYRSDQDVVIALHGSHWIDDWLHNMKSFKEESSPSSKGKIHAGFKHISDNIFPSLLMSLKIALSAKIIEFTQMGVDLQAEKNKTKPISLNWSEKRDFNFTFTGHSLGGALAVLAAMKLHDLQEKLREDHSIHIADSGKPFSNQIKAITFSAPKVGDINFAEEIKGKLGRNNILQFQCTSDPTPQLPLSLFGYTDLGCSINYLGLEQMNDKVQKGLEYLLNGQGLHVRGEVLDRYAKFIIPVAHILTKLAIDGIPVAALSAVSFGAGAAVAGIEIAVATVKLLHEMPTEETVVLSLRETQRHISYLSDDPFFEHDHPGNVSWWSVQRNPPLNFIYNTFFNVEPKGL